MLIIQQEVHIFLVDIYQEDLRINININQFQNTVTREPARNTRRAGHGVYGNKAPQPLEYEEGLLRTGIFREPWGLPENACRCLPE